MKKPSLRFSLVALVAVAIVSGSAYYGYAASAGGSDLITPTATVTTSTIQSSVPAEGRIEVARWELEFSGQGMVAEVFVKPGDTVTAGQVLATIDADKANTQIAQAQAALAAADAKLGGTLAGPAVTDLAVKQASVNAAADSLASAQEAYDLLVAESAGTTVTAAVLQAKESAITNAASALNVAEANLAAAGAGATSAEIAAARATVAQAEASAESAGLAAEDMVLTAPVDGTVIQVNIKPGTAAPSGGVPALVIADMENLFAEASLDENDYVKTSVGLPVDVLVDALDGATLEGTVTSLALVGEADQNGIVAYSLTAAIDAAATKAAPGMTVRLDIITERVQDVLVIPNEAVRIENGQQVVTVIDDAGTESTVPVSLGMTDGTVVEVAQGLEAGQRVALPGSEQ